MRKDPADAFRAQELAEQIHQKECELQRRYSQMGKSLLEIAEGGQRTINRLVDEIIEARAELAQIEAQQECPNCTAYNEEDSRYCRRCGVKLADREAEKES